MSKIRNTGISSLYQNLYQNQRTVGQVVPGKSVNGGAIMRRIRPTMRNKFINLKLLYFNGQSFLILEFQNLFEIFQINEKSPARDDLINKVNITMTSRNLVIFLIQNI